MKNQIKQFYQRLDCLVFSDILLQKAIFFNICKDINDNVQIGNNLLLKIEAKKQEIVKLITLYNKEIEQIKNSNKKTKYLEFDSRGYGTFCFSDEASKLLNNSQKKDIEKLQASLNKINKLGAEIERLENEYNYRKELYNKNVIPLANNVFDNSYSYEALSEIQFKTEINNCKNDKEVVQLLINFVYNLNEASLYGIKQMFETARQKLSDGDLKNEMEPLFTFIDKTKIEEIFNKKSQIINYIIDKTKILNNEQIQDTQLNKTDQNTPNEQDNTQQSSENNKRKRRFAVRASNETEYTAKQTGIELERQYNYKINCNLEQTIQNFSETSKIISKVINFGNNMGEW